MDYSNKQVLTEKEVSSLFKVSTSYLQKRRMKGDGPSYSKVGTRVYYRKDDVEQFLLGKPFTATAQYDTPYKRKARTASTTAGARAS